MMKLFLDWLPGLWEWPGSRSAVSRQRKGVRRNRLWWVVRYLDKTNQCVQMFYIQWTPFIDPHSGPGGRGAFRRRGHKTLLTLTELCVQLAMHKQYRGQWVSFVVAAMCTYLSVRVSPAYGHCSPHHRASQIDHSMLYWLWHPVATVWDSLQCLQWDNRVSRWRGQLLLRVL